MSSCGPKELTEVSGKMCQGVWPACSLVEGGNERRERGDGPLGPLLVEGGARARTSLRCVPTDHSPTVEDSLEGKPILGPDP